MIKQDGFHFHVCLREGNGATRSVKMSGSDPRSQANYLDVLMTRKPTQTFEETYLSSLSSL